MTLACKVAKVSSIAHVAMMKKVSCNVLVVNHESVIGLSFATSAAVADPSYVVKYSELQVHL